MDIEQSSPRCTVLMVDNCQFQNWYYLFKKVTFKADIFELPNEFREYLMEDGVMMPNSYSLRESGEGEDNDEEHSESEDDEDEPKHPKYNFSEVESWIQETLDKYSEKAFVKLNWSAPRDSNWMVPNLNCSSVKEVFLLLKSSIFINHDVICPYEGCVDKTDYSSPEKLVLVLKRYHQNVRKHKDNEFRCFVKNHTLIAVSQRDTQMFYEELVENLEGYKSLITNFFDQEIKCKFPDSNYVFDVYIDIPPNNKVWLIDFNPWILKTDPCLFEWNEILCLPECASHSEVKWKILIDTVPIKSNEMTQYHVPSEIVENPNSEELKKFFEDMKQGKISKDYFQ